MTPTRITASQLVAGDTMIEAPRSTAYRGALSAAADWSAVDALKAATSDDAKRSDQPVGVVHAVRPLSNAARLLPTLTVDRGPALSPLVLPADAIVYVAR